MNLNRRFWLQGAAALAMTVPAWRATARSSASRAPVARVEPVSETFYGQTVVDPYRWMENATDPDWEPYMRANAAHARGVFDAIPGRTALAQRIEALSAGAATARAPTPAGERLFFQKREVGAQSYALQVRDGDGRIRTLVDPNTMKGVNGAHVSLDWWKPSPDGSHVVYGLSEAGSEDSILHIMTVDTGRDLPETIDRTQYADPSWLPDGSGFFYLRLSGAAPKGSTEYYFDSICWLHRLGSSAEQDQKIMARGLDPDIPSEPSEFPFVGVDPSSKQAVLSIYGGVRRENPIWTAPLSEVLAGKAKWRPVGKIEDELIAFTMRGDDLWLVTTKDAENGKVIRTSASAPDLASAQVVVSEGATVIEGVVATADALYVQRMDGGYGRIDRVAADGVTAVALPYEGSVAEMKGQTGSPDLYLTLTSWLEPVGVWKRGADGVLVDTGLSPRPNIDTSGFELIRDFATVRDGAKVPLSIIAPKGLKRDGSNPTMVEAYGAYQIVSLPAFDVRGIALLEQGGVQAVAHVRGGGEYGKRWWKAGQKLTKPNTWRDLIDCCEHLVKEGWTSPAKLGIIGGSAGGITMGRALTERPDLFALVVPQVGCLNPLRMEFTQNGPTNIDEFGTVTTEEGFRGLYEMDSLHHVVDGTRYPAVLLTHGMTDPRVEPWHSGKMAARLRAAKSADSGTVVLRVDFDAGHGMGSTRSQYDAERADIYALFLRATGRF